MNKETKVLAVTMNPAIDQTVFVPNFRAGEVNRVERMQLNAGGKGVNVASLLADYGLPVAATGLLGVRNPLSFEELFEQKDIKDAFVRVPGSTRIGVKIINELEAQTTDLNFPGLEPRARDLEILKAEIYRHAASCDWVVFAGSLPTGVATDFYREIIAETRTKCGCRIALDTSGPALVDALTATPNLIKPNREELEEMLGHPLDSLHAVADAARELQRSGVETVVISMGADGAVFAEGDEVIHVKPGPVTLLSTVGAGDAMVSGMVAGALEGKTLKERGALATAFSVSALSRIGANLAVREELMALSAACTVTSVE